MTPDTITVTVYAPFHSERHVRIRAKREQGGMRYFANPRAMNRAWEKLCAQQDSLCELPYNEQIQRAEVAFYARGHDIELLWWDRTAGAAFRALPRRSIPADADIFSSSYRNEGPGNDQY